jgi:hypothetical protein
MLRDQAARADAACIGVRNALSDLAWIVESAQRAQDRIERMQAACDVLERSVHVLRGRTLAALVEKQRLDRLAARARADE